MNKTLLILILGLILINGCDQQVKENSSRFSLSEDKKIEICREIRIYTDYCYNTGISANDCGNQIAEKIMRIFELSPDQVKEVVNYCK